MLGLAFMAHSVAVQGLSACLGIGYLVAAIFPCDVGSPSTGGGRQQIHNLGGVVEYAGGTYFIFHATTPTVLFMETKIIVSMLIICFVLISFQSSFRGGIQRVAEFILFSSLIQLSSIG